jgi:hypothetical protein
VFSLPASPTAHLAPKQLIQFSSVCRVGFLLLFFGFYKLIDEINKNISSFHSNYYEKFAKLGLQTDGEYGLCSEVRHYQGLSQQGMNHQGVSRAQPNSRQKNVKFHVVFGQNAKFHGRLFGFFLKKKLHQYTRYPMKNSNLH